MLHQHREVFTRVFAHAEEQGQYPDAGHPLAHQLRGGGRHTLSVGVRTRRLERPGPPDRARELLTPTPMENTGT